MKNFTKFSMKNTFVILLAVILIAIGGIYSAMGIKEEAMPNISIPVVTIYTVYPGANPSQVSTDVTKPIRSALSGIEGITDIKGISNQNVSIIQANFDYSSDIDKGLRDIEDAMNKVTLPSSAQKPNIAKITMGSFPAMTYSIQSSKNINDLTKFVNNTLEPGLNSVAGVSSVDVKGLNNDDVYIKLDEQKMKDNNITLQQVQNIISANNITSPLGNKEINQKDFAVTMANGFSNVNDIKSIPIIVQPDTSKIIGDSFSQIQQGMNQMGTAIGDLGQSVSQMGQQMGSLAEGTKAATNTLGNMISSNTQCIGILSVIQQQEAIILNEQTVLSNTKATAQDKEKAKQAMEQANSVIQSSTNSLKQILASEQEAGKALSSNGSSSKPPSSTNNNSNISNGKSTGNNSSISMDNQVKVVFLKDIADISSGSEDNGYYVRSNYKDGMVLNIYKTDDSNTVQLANDVSQKISDISKSNKDIKFSKIDDSSKTVKDSVDGMMDEGITGAIFAMIIIALFLRNLRSTIIAVVSIPLSVLIALIVIPRFGITLNTMSLGGIAVAVGRIVDDSIVVIENIYRRLSLSKETDNAALIEEATNEVGSAIAASTITTVGVFLPLGFISGLIGKVFVPFAYTVVICILASLLVALTVVPVMSRFMLSRSKIKHTEKEGVIALGYKKILNSVLNHRVAVLIVCFMTLVLSLGFLKKIGVQFMPTSNSNVINVKMTMPVGTSADKTNEEAIKYEKYLKGRSDVVDVASVIGDTSSSNTSVLSNQASNVGTFTIVLKESENIDKAVNELNEEAKKYSSNGEIMTVTPESSTGTQSDNVQVVINGNNIDDITKAAGIITNKLKNMSTLNNVTNNISEKSKKISIAVDPNKAAQNGITPASAAQIVKYYLGYSKVTTINQDSSNNTNTIDVMLGYNSQDIDSIDKIKNLVIQGSNGDVKIGDIANVNYADGPATISELDGNQYAEVDANIVGNDTNKVTKEAKSEIDSIKKSLPAGITYDLQGSNKSISDGFSQMAMAMVVAVMLVYIVMVITFGEPITPFAILFSLPFAGVGAITALYIAKQPLTVSGMIGMLMLIGIVVTNAIVLLDRVKTYRANGMEVKEALLEAGAVRLRPILMTAISTVMALIPLVLGFSHGNLISQGLGIAVMGGLVFSTILTLIIVPVMYSVLNGLKK